jgi:hypothetical protein
MLNVSMQTTFNFARGPATRRRQALLLFCLLLFGPLLPAEAQQAGTIASSEPEPKKRKIFGTVIEQRKYSLRIASGEEDLEVAVPDKVPIDQRLDKPRIDLASGVVLQELLGSQASGSSIPIEIQDTLPEQLGIAVEFAHLNERKRIMSENPKKLVRYRLLPLEQLPSDPENELLLTGKVLSVDERGQVVLQTSNEELLAELGNRDGRLGGRNIADLRPFETDVEILADQIDGKWVAQSVLFRRVKWTSTKNEEATPRILVLGDEVSLSYLHSLRKKLSGTHEVYHPPENCRGSVNWERLPIWLGPYREAGYRWDVIVFNLGLGDLHTEVAQYRSALKSILPQLRATGARLVWLSTTPLPNAWEGTVANTGRKISRADAQAKIKELNLAAGEELASSSDIQQVDLSGEMENKMESSFASWAAGRSPMLSREQSEWVAEKIQQSLQALAQEQR